MAWRDRVYSGTLRPIVNTNHITGDYLDEVLNALTAQSSYICSMSEAHSVNRIDVGLYLGDKNAARNKRWLNENGFTHVLNCSDGPHEYQVNTGPGFYRHTNIKYMGIPGHDRPSWNIGVYFEDAAQFVHNAISKGGKVLVHCVVGVSRSATIVIAYLMIHKQMRALEALKFVFARRRVFPNSGFLVHLAHLHNSLYNRTSIQLPYRGSVLSSYV